MNRLIIDQPELQGKKGRRLSQVFTLLFWVLWFSLWIPVLNLFVWLVGFEPFYEPPLLFPGPHQLVALITWHVIVIALIPLTLAIWVMYNLMQFGKQKRRRYPDPLPGKELAGHFHVDPGELAHWQKSRRVVMELDENGEIRKVTLGAKS